MAFHRFCRGIVEQQPLRIFGDGTQTRDFTFVYDVVAATRAAAAVDYRPGEVFNVGGGSRIPLNSAIDLLGELAGRKPLVEYENVQLGDARHTGADISAARRRLSYAPTVDLREGLSAELAWITAQHDAAAPASVGTQSRV